MKIGNYVRFKWAKEASGIIESIDGHQIKIRSCWNEGLLLKDISQGRTFLTDRSALIVCKAPERI